MSTPNSNNIALIHAHLYVYIAQFRAYFLRNQPFSNPKPIFLCLRFQRESPVEDMLFEKGVLFIYAVRMFAPLSRTWLFAKQVCFAIECQRLIQTILH